MGIPDSGEKNASQIVRFWGEQDQYGLLVGLGMLPGGKLYF